MAIGLIATALAELETERANLSKVYTNLDKVKISLNEQLDKDPLPRRFAGVADNYRFTTGPKGTMPTHRFEVLCGNGLFIHVEATPERFAQIMVDMDMGDITPKKVNNKIVVVERGPEAGTYPIKMYKGDVYAAQDKWNNFLWPEAPVILDVTGEKGRIAPNAILLGEERPALTVEVIDSDGVTDRFVEKFCDSLVLNL